MYTKRAANGPEEERKGVNNSKAVPKRQCHGDKLVKEILAGDELTDEHITFATALGRGGGAGAGATSPFFSEICTFFFVPVITFPPFILCK